MPSPAPLDQKIEEFLQYLQVEKGSSKLTIRNYSHYLHRFSDYLGGAGLTSSITQENVSKFRHHLATLADKNGNVLGRRTQSYHIIALRSFLKWLAKRDYEVLAPEKLDLPKIPDRKVTFLSSEHVERLLSGPSLYGVSGKRDKAMLEMLFSTGLRVSELVKLNRDNVDTKRREFGRWGQLFNAGHFHARHVFWFCVNQGWNDECRRQPKRQQ
jgi:site-specific recombinase XerD